MLNVLKLLFVIKLEFYESIVAVLYFMYHRQAKMLLTQPYVYPQRTLNSRKLHIRKSLSKDIFCADTAYIGIVHVPSN